RAPLGNLEQFHYQVGCLGAEVWLARVGQIERGVKERLAGVVEMGIEDSFLGAFDPEAPLQELKCAAHGEGGRREDHRLHALEQTLAQDGGDIDGRGFEEQSATPPLPPENEIGVVPLEDEFKRLAQL